MSEKTSRAAKPSLWGVGLMLSAVFLLGGCAPMPLQTSLANFSGRPVPYYLYSPHYTTIRPGAWFGSSNPYDPSGPYANEPGR